MRLGLPLWQYRVRLPRPRAKDAKKMACEVLPPLKIDEALDVWSQIPTWLPPMYTVVRLLWLCKGVPGPRSAYAVDLPPSDVRMPEQSLL